MTCGPDPATSTEPFSCFILIYSSSLFVVGGVLFVCFLFVVSTLVAGVKNSTWYSSWQHSPKAPIYPSLTPVAGTESTHKSITSRVSLHTQRHLRKYLVRQNRQVTRHRAQSKNVLFHMTVNFYVLFCLFPIFFSVSFFCSLICSLISLLSSTNSLSATLRWHPCQLQSPGLSAVSW